MLTDLRKYQGSRTSVKLHLTNSTTNLGSSGTATTTVISGGGGSTAVYPTTVDDYMVFNGTTNLIRYPETNDAYHVSFPYSVELEFMLTDSTNTNRYIATLGEGYGAGYGEWTFHVNSGYFAVTSSSNNSSDTTSLTLGPFLNINEWYKVGIMFYNNGSNRLRVYFNGKTISDTAVAQPYNSANGIAIGGDNTNRPARSYKGRLRNIWVGNSAFWTI